MDKLKRRSKELLKKFSITSLKSSFANTPPTSGATPSTLGDDSRYAVGTASIPRCPPSALSVGESSASASLDPDNATTVDPERPKSHGKSFRDRVDEMGMNGSGLHPDILALIAEPEPARATTSHSADSSENMDNFLNARRLEREENANHKSSTTARKPPQILANKNLTAGINPRQLRKEIPQKVTNLESEALRTANHQTVQDQLGTQISPGNVQRHMKNGGDDSGEM